MTERDRLYVRIAELEQSEARFRALVQNAFDMIYVIDSNGIVGYVSLSTHRETGYASDELIGTPIWDRLHPEDISEVQSAFRECVQVPGRTQSVEVRYR